MIFPPKFPVIYVLRWCPAGALQQTSLVYISTRMHVWGTYLQFYLKVLLHINATKVPAQSLNPLASCFSLMHIRYPSIVNWSFLLFLSFHHFSLVLSLSWPLHMQLFLKSIMMFSDYVWSESTLIVLSLSHSSRFISYWNVRGYRYIDLYMFRCWISENDHYCCWCSLYKLWSKFYKIDCYL